jgi:hypothetical protein
MADFFGRMAERADGSEQGVRPLIAPAFVTAPQTPLPVEQQLPGEEVIEQIRPNVPEHPVGTERPLQRTESATHSPEPPPGSKEKSFDGSRIGSNQTPQQLPRPLERSAEERPARTEMPRSSAPIAAMQQGTIGKDAIREERGPDAEWPSAPIATTFSPPKESNATAPEIHEPSRRMSPDDTVTPIQPAQRPATPVRPQVVSAYEGQHMQSDDRFERAASARPPVIRVTIGRVEVRAVISPPIAPAPAAATSKESPKLSLEEYLKRSSGGSR